MLFSSDAVDELIVAASTVVQPAVLAAAHYYAQKVQLDQRTPRVAVPRQRNSVSHAYNSLGPRLFRRAFRMTFDAFWRLHSILLSHIETAISKRRDYVRKGGRDGGNFSLPPIPNGPISTSIRLGAALRYFAGGSAYDICLMFGISHSEVLSCVWIVVDAINQCPQFQISYPASLEEQRRIACGFEAASTPGIHNCAVPLMASLFGC